MHVVLNNFRHVMCHCWQRQSVVVYVEDQCHCTAVYIGQFICAHHALIL